MHISGNACAYFTKFSVRVACGMAWSFSGGFLVLYFSAFVYDVMFSYDGGVTIRQQLCCMILGGPVQVDVRHQD